MMIRKFLLRRLGVLLLIMFVILSDAPILAKSNQLAQTLIVDREDDDLNVSGCTTANNNDCNLRGAMSRAQNQPGTTIQFDSNYTITPLTELPELSGEDTAIVATGRDIKINGAALSYIFLITGDGITLDNMSLYASREDIIKITQKRNQRIIIKNNKISDSAPGSCASLLTDNGIAIRNDESGPNPDNSSKIFIYGNTIECIFGGNGNIGGILLDDTNNVFIGVKEDESTVVANIIRSNNNGIVVMWDSKNTLIKGNIISENEQNGIFIKKDLDQTPTNTKIFNNIIGSRNGNDDNGNKLSGIFVSDSNDTIIGDDDSTRNIIIGNDRYGVEIVSGAEGTKILGNYIGVGSDGRTDRGNTLGGILISGSSGTEVGGTTFDKLNVIAGNDGHGITISGGATNNIVQFNDIGFNSVHSSVTNIGNSNAGIRISGAGTSNNRIGADTTVIPRIQRSFANSAPLVDEKANFIAHNVGPGVSIEGADGNFILANTLLNNSYGIDLNNSENTLIEYVSISDNRGAGIYERGGSMNNQWNTIAMLNNGNGDNDIEGIRKSTTTPARPVITGMRRTATKLEMTGTASANAEVQIYLADIFGANKPQGQRWRETVSVSAQGKWEADFDLASVTPNRCYVAFQTINNDSSAFSEVKGSSLQCDYHRVYAPLIRR